MASRSKKRLMRRGGLVAGVAGIGVAAVLAVGGPTPAGAGEPASFAFAIGNHTLDGPAAELTDRYDRFDLVVIDNLVGPGKVEAIQAGGATVLGYLSVGTIESYRPWYEKLKRYRLSAWQDWKDEWFADTSKAAYRRKVVRIAEDEVLAKGFDGLFLDNVDMVEVKRHKKQRKGMGMLVADLDELLGGKPLFAQNGAPGVLDGYPAQNVDPLIDHLDGWNREDVTWTYDFDRRRYVQNSNGDREAALEELQEIGDEGLTTTATDYVKLPVNTESECEAVTNALGVGALSYLGNIGLTLEAVQANPPADC